MKRQKVLQRIAAIIAFGDPSLIEKLDDPNFEWSFDEYTGPNSWIRHEGVTVGPAEVQKVKDMIPVELERAKNHV